jgi:flagellar biosynthetic protein FliP
MDEKTRLMQLLQQRKYVVLFLILAGVLCLGISSVFAQALPKVSVDFAGEGSKEDSALVIQILFLITVLSLAPAILIMMTSFTRLVIVFHFLRQALGTQQTPGNQIIVGLSLFLTFFIMQPVINEINEGSIQPYLSDEITQSEAMAGAVKPIRTFMLKQVREKDLMLFIKLAKLERPQSQDDLPTYVLIPAFIISEVRIAFQLGFVVYLPLLLIDLIVGVILMSMGMMMLPPIMISMPFKILLFVLVDGWYLVVESMVSGF